MPTWLDFWTRVDAWASTLVPPSTASDPRRHERGTLLVRLALLAFGVGAFMLAMISFGHRNVYLSVFHVVTIGCILLGPAIMKRTQNVTPAAIWILVHAWTLLTVESIALGGVDSPAFSWIALLPLGAMLLSGRKGALIWGSIAMLTVLAMAGAETIGILPGSGLGPAGIANRVASVFILASAVTGCAWIYELELDRKIGRLDRERRAFERAATSDPLTDLPNRALLTDRVEQAQARARRDRSLAALLYVDLDDFKRVNDELGHDAGDQVLRNAAERMRRNVRGCDTVIRLGGDEFVVVIEALRSSGDAALAAENMAAQLVRPYPIEGGRQVGVGISIGIAMIRGDVETGEGVTAENLLKAADRAMYEAKRAGLRHAFAGEPEV